MIRFLTLLIATAALAACSILQSREADKLYVLKAQIATAAQTLPLSLKIGRPEAGPGLESNRIAVQEGPSKLNYYEGVAWPSPFPEVAQSFLSDAFEQSRSFRMVGTDEQGMKSDLTLLTDILNAETDRGGDAPVVKLRLSVKLVSSSSREALATKVIEKNITAQSGGMEGVIAAYTQAFNEAAQETISLAVEAGQAFTPEPVAKKKGK